MQKVKESVTETAEARISIEQATCVTNLRDVRYNNSAEAWF